MKRTIEKGQDIVDSRDVIDRIEELTDERKTLTEALQEAREAHDACLNNAPDMDTDLAATLEERQQELEEWEDEYGEELQELLALADEGSVSPDWEHGETLIHERHFVDYCQELTADIGNLPKDLPSYLVIDWEATADNLRQYYSEIDWGEETYLIRG